MTAPAERRYPQRQTPGIAPLVTLGAVAFRLRQDNKADNPRGVDGINMSGERQHFLPRFLLRGFASRTDGQETYTWVFRRGREPFQSNIINVGVSKEFYTSGDDAGLDDLITKMEGTFGLGVNSLRSQTHDYPLQAANIPELVTHLVLRTKHLRDMIHKPSEYFIRALLAELERPGVLEKMVLNSIKSRPDKFAKSLFKGHHLSRRERLRRLDTIMEIAPTLIATQIPMFRVLISGLKQQLPKKIPQALKEGHIKAMTRNPLPQARVDFARALKWFLLVRQNGHFILGDVGVANKVGPNGELKSLPDITDDIVRTWLPISDTHLIVGVKGSAVIGEEVENINLETAALSSDFFVSRTNTDREKSYAVVLGTQSRLFSDEQLQETVSEVLAESALF